MSALTRTQVFDTLRRNALDVVPELDPAAFAAERTLSELGCNSIDRAEIVTLTMEELGIVVPVHEFQQGYDLATLVDVMLKHA
ncbi:phosphopantetheine-binding protein [Kitasatospora sp. NPDC056138]|uniref:phosphopantetheine-binding protein n=1 Tax=Kitasatospora sp. NPDC056138 TaxID=3345724 RepID=UPI0035DD49D9